MLRPTWVEIDLKAIAHNLYAVKKLVGPSVKIMAVVKSDAYGHGASHVADALARNCVDQLAVATLDEAVTLRETGIRLPILVLGTTVPGEGVDAAIEFDLTLALCSLELAHALSTTAEQRGKKALVHLKIDTGLSRIGVRPEEAVGFMKALKDLPGLKFEGIFSHLAAADEPNNPYTTIQLQRFRQVIHNLEKAGFIFSLKHIANSAAILSLPGSYFDMVRPGAILYGLWPGKQLRAKSFFRPTFALKTRIIYLKEVPAGTPVSYGLTHRTDSSTVIATLPIGYGDGYSRTLGNKGNVLIKGSRVPVIGTVCMDQCMVDVSNVAGVSLGDEVVMLGSQGTEQISAVEVADLCSTVAPDVYCGISARVPRIYS